MLHKIELMEAEASASWINGGDGTARFTMTFDGNRTPLRVIADFRRNIHDCIYTYRRGGLDLSRSQAMDLINRDAKHGSR